MSDAQKPSLTGLSAARATAKKSQIEMIQTYSPDYVYIYICMCTYMLCIIFYTNIYV